MVSAQRNQGHIFTLQRAMSYNGIGLSTARGSGTNGYIQKNTTRVSESKYKRRQENKRQSEKVAKLVTVKDKSLVDRERRREIELRVSELRDELEDQDMDGELIDEKCDQLRQELLHPAKTHRRKSDRVDKEVELDY